MFKSPRLLSVLKVILLMIIYYSFFIHSFLLRTCFLCSVNVLWCSSSCPACLVLQSSCGERERIDLPHVLLLSFGCRWPVSFPRGVVGWAVVCDCDIFLAILSNFCLPVETRGRQKLQSTLNRYLVKRALNEFLFLNQNI